MISADLFLCGQDADCQRRFLLFSRIPCENPAVLVCLLDVKVATKVPGVHSATLEIDETNVDDESGWFILLFHYDHEQRVRE